MGKAEQVEASIATRIGEMSRWLEVHHAGLDWMQAQTISTQALGQGLHDPCRVTLIAEAQNSIAYPLVQHGPELAFVQGVEERFNVQFDHPAASHRLELSLDRLQCLMRRTLRSESIRAIECDG
ncbi:MAG: hypothetical protein EPN71_05475, partial [Rhodanobacter sp.]